MTRKAFSAGFAIAMVASAAVAYIKSTRTDYEFQRQAVGVEREKGHDYHVYMLADAGSTMQMVCQELDTKPLRKVVHPPSYGADFVSYHSEQGMFINVSPASKSQIGTITHSPAAAKRLRGLMQPGKKYVFVEIVKPPQFSVAAWAADELGF